MLTASLESCDDDPDQGIVEHIRRRVRIDWAHRSSPVYLLLARSPLLEEALIAHMQVKGPRRERARLLTENRLDPGRR